MENLFIKACSGGNLKQAQQLLLENPTINILAENERAFRYACSNGHLKVAQWLFHLASTLPSLASTFLKEGVEDKERVEDKEDGIDISFNNEYAFYYACGHGHLKVAQWLLEIKPTINILFNNGCTFCIICENGHLEVAQWLFHLASTPPSLASTIPNGIVGVEAKEGGIDISVHDEWAFRQVCLKGHLEMAQWLLSIKPTIDISAGEEYAFRNACDYRHLGVIRWLIHLRPDKYIFINNKAIVRDKKYKLWYKMQYLIELHNTSIHVKRKENTKYKHYLYQLSNDILWLMTFYI